MSDTGEEGVRAILKAENLGHFNWFEDRYPRADEVGIVVQGAGWRVYSTDERANPRYDKVYGDEGQALDDFLKMVRATNDSFALRDKRLRKQSDAADAQ